MTSDSSTTDTEELSEQQEAEIRMLETVRDWDSIAHEAYENGVITEDERDEYIRIENKIWEGEIEREKSGERSVDPATEQSGGGGDG